MSKDYIFIKKESEVFYIYLPDHRGRGKSGAVKKQTRLLDCIDHYEGPDVYLDFDEKGRLVGIELLM